MLVYGGNQSAEAEVGSISMYWETVLEHVPQGSGCRTKPDRVQDAFGQCSHSHGMTLGVSSAESGVGLFMILVGQSIFQLGISCDAVIMTVMKNLGKLKRRL